MPSPLRSINSLDENKVDSPKDNNPKAKVPGGESRVPSAHPHPLCCVLEPSCPLLSIALAALGRAGGVSVGVVPVPVPSP